MEDKDIHIIIAELFQNLEEKLITKVFNKLNINENKNTVLQDINNSTININIANELLTELYKEKQNLQHRFNVQAKPYFFIGREKELKQIDEELQKNNILLLSGLGGIGKTSIALQYINTPIYSKNFDRIFWFSNFGSLTDDLIYNFRQSLQIQFDKENSLSDKRIIIKDKLYEYRNDKTWFFIKVCG